MLITKIALIGVCISAAGVIYTVSGQSQGAQWVTNRVPYVIDGNFPRDKVGEINAALNEYHKKTCIRFTPKTASDPGWVNFLKDDNTCGAAYGCFANGPRNATFGGSCIHSGVITHELAHTLCLSHEQERPDRDNYLGFAAGCSPSYKWDWRDPRMMDLFYDYVSITHYEDTRCYVSKLPGVTHFGSGGTLSVLDAEKINAYYNCGGCYSYRFRPISKITSSDRLLVSGYDGNVIFSPCRTYFNGDIIPGKGYKEACYVPYNGAERKVTANFELLTNPQNANFVWQRRAPGTPFPANAIPGGRTANREPLYIGRCTISVGGKVTQVSGKLHLSVTQKLYIPYGGAEYVCDDYEVLVCN